MHIFAFALLYVKTLKKISYQSGCRQEVCTDVLLLFSQMYSHFVPINANMTFYLLLIFSVSHKRNDERKMSPKNILEILISLYM